ncbi:MAG: LysR family transcriptional regulator [Pigmentiphaga sp.]
MKFDYRYVSYLIFLTDIVKMRKSLPPLSMLRSFEAAARNSSFKRAAAELNVTPAAISHQVIQLESLLGVRLFVRDYRKVVLTPTGIALAPKLQEGFEVLERALYEVDEERKFESLNIITTPAFAYQCLMPRLHHLISEHPTLDVQVTTRLSKVSSAARAEREDILSVMNWTEECDAVICLGRGNYAGMEVDRVLPLTITPLCSPKFAEKYLDPDDPTSLREAPLLHDDRGLIYEGQAFWDMWLRAAHITEVDTSCGQHLSHSTIAVDAAVSGQGIVATTIELARSKVESGQLIAPFPISVPWSIGYYLVATNASAEREAVQALRTWLLNTMGANNTP